MKVAFFHELHFGGARRVVSDYATHFKKDHEITLYYTDSKKESDLEKQFNKSYFFSFKPVYYSGNNWRAKLYKDFLELYNLYRLHRKIASEIDKEQYDFVFVHLSQFTHAPFLLRFLKTKSVYFCHEPLRIAHDPAITLPNTSTIKKSYEKVIRTMRMLIDNQNIQKATLVLANSEYSQKNIKSAYNIDARLCYLGVDPQLFKPLKQKKQYDLLFVGDTIYMEGYDTFLDICKLFDKKLNVHVIRQEKGKYVTDKELVSYYNSTKLVVVLGRFDPFSMIPNEAMSCETCPLVVNEGGPVEAVIHNKTGYIVNRDPQKFKVIIEKLLADDSLRSRIGKNGRESVIFFWNWKKSYERLMNIVQSELDYAKK